MVVNRLPNSPIVSHRSATDAPFVCRVEESAERRYWALPLSNVEGIMLVGRNNRIGKMCYNEAVVTRSVADLHAKTSRRSERVTQVVLGTPLMVAKERRTWLRVTTPDAYRGWIEVAATRRLKFREPRYAFKGRIAVVKSNVAVIYLEPSREARESITVTVDTRLELVSEQTHRCRVRLPGLSYGWIRREDVSIRPAGFNYAVTNRQRTAESGKRFLGVPYLWGGTTPLGFDCSGFVQLVYKMNGVSIPRDADMQFMIGTPIDTLDVAAADLVFFSNGSSGITHVGIYLANGEFLHSSGRASGVTINRLNEPFFRSIFVGARRLWHSA